MKRSDNRPAFIAGIFLFVIYLVGTTGISLPRTHELFAGLTPISLLVSTILLLAFHRSWSLRAVLVFTGIALAGFLIEIIGVETGVIFGEYSYGVVLGPSVDGVPLIIGLNWLILIYITGDLAGRIFKYPALKVIGTAILMVLFDLLMEPVAITLDMWHWSGQGIPLLNYLAWFVISLVFAGMIHGFSIRLRNPLSGYLLLFMALFFGVLNITL